jgi:hypothetical protein
MSSRHHVSGLVRSYCISLHPASVHASVWPASVFVTAFPVNLSLQFASDQRTTSRIINSKGERRYRFLSRIRILPVTMATTIATTAFLSISLDACSCMARRNATRNGNSMQ